MRPDTRKGASHTKVTRAQPMRGRGKQHLCLALGSESRSRSCGGAKGEGGLGSALLASEFFFSNKERYSRGLCRGAAR